MHVGKHILVFGADLVLLYAYDELTGFYFSWAVPLVLWRRFIFPFRVLHLLVRVLWRVTLYIYVYVYIYLYIHIHIYVYTLIYT